MIAVFFLRQNFNGQIIHVGVADFLKPAGIAAIHIAVATGCATIFAVRYLKNELWNTVIIQVNLQISHKLGWFGRFPLFLPRKQERMVRFDQVPNEISAN